MKAKHLTDRIASCPACITQAEIDKYPWQTYQERLIQGERDYLKKHRQAMARKERGQAMRDMGLVKVKGSLGGTYWE